LTYLEWDQGREEESEIAFQAILKNAEEKKEFTNQIECYNALALMDERHSRYKKSISYYLKGLKIAEDQDEQYYIAVFLNNIGLLKLNNSQFDEALKDFTRGVKISEKMNNARLTSHIYNNIALIYMEKGKKEEAIQQYHNILKYARKSGNPRELGIAALNLSTIYLQDSNYVFAHKYCDTAIATFSSNHFTFELTKCYLSKAQLLLKEKKYDHSLVYANKALHLTDSTKNLEDAVGVHFTMAGIYEKQHKSVFALDEYKLYKKLNDSLKELMNTKAITEIQAKYHDERKDAEIEKGKNKNLALANKNLLLEQKNAEEKKIRDRNTTIIVISSIILLVVVGGYFYAAYSRKTRLQQQRFSQQLIHRLEEERNRISKDLHDDIGQSLSAIKSRINLIDQEEMGKGKLKGLENDMGQVIEQTRDISRKLYPSYLEKIGLVRSVARLMEGIQESTGMVCSFEIDEDIDRMNIKVLTHIYRIIQECVNNTIKHSGATALKVTVLKRDDQFQLIYMDNGKGLAKGVSKSNGIGFMSLKERARIISGEMNIGDNSGKGFRLILNFSKTIG
jgi:two-component system, NarL family, sensor kinase